MTSFTTPRWLQATALSLTAILVSATTAQAQDYEAVKRRLDAAVAAGEITADQATEMMKALRQAAKDADAPKVRKVPQPGSRVPKPEANPATRQPGSGPSEEAKRAEYDALVRDLTEAVRVGAMTPEQAKKKRLELRAQLWGNGKSQPVVDKKSQSKADAKRASMDERLASEKERRKRANEKESRKRAKEESAKKGGLQEAKAQYEELEKSLTQSVKKGELTKEEAKKKLDEARKRLFGKGSK